MHAMHPRTASFVAIALLFTTGLLAQTKPTTKPHNFARWEPNIAKLEQQDAQNKPASGGVMFLGSSTIVRWKTLASDFPEAKPINHGFGGSDICDSTYYADRIIFPLAPKTIFLRAGTNDIHGGKNAEQVFQDYKDFVAKVRTKLPDTTIVFIGLCPAPSRWKDRDETRKLNQLVETYTKETPGLQYIESYDLSLDANGNAREELFVKDRLHFNDEGYKLLIDRVRPFIPKESNGK
jgi:lysophospholipase L1-like esterase